MNVRHGRRSRRLGALARAPWLTGILLAASLALTPIGSQAQRAADATSAARAAGATAADEGAATALRYIGCAASIAFASTTLQIWLAALTCTTLLVEALE